METYRKKCVPVSLMSRGQRMLMMSLNKATERNIAAWRKSEQLVKLASTESDQQGEASLQSDADNQSTVDHQSYVDENNISDSDSDIVHKNKLWTNVKASIMVLHNDNIASREQLVKLTSTESDQQHHAANQQSDAERQSDVDENNISDIVRGILRTNEKPTTVMPDDDDTVTYTKDALQQSMVLYIIQITSSLFK